MKHTKQNSVITSDNEVIIQNSSMDCHEVFQTSHNDENSHSVILRIYSKNPFKSKTSSPVIPENSKNLSGIYNILKRKLINKIQGRFLLLQEGQNNSLKTNTSNSISYKLVASSLNKTYGFTLVELIVIITILAILGTIAFVSFGSYSSSARDSNRVSNVSLIDKGIALSIAAGKTINTFDTLSGTNIVIVGSGGISFSGYYDNIGKKILSSINVSGEGLLNDNFQTYKYTFLPNDKYYQVSATLENQLGSAYLNYTSTDHAYATTTSSGYTFIKGNFPINTASGGYIKGIIPSNCDVISGCTISGTGSDVLVSGDKNTIKEVISTDPRDKFLPGNGYTYNWNTNLCTPSNMSIVYLTGGTDKIPSSLSGNTVYVLEPGNYIQSYTIQFGGNCIGFIGNGNKDDIKLYSNIQLSGNGNIYLNNKNNSIIENINIDGRNNGIGGSHSDNIEGIYIYSSSSNTFSGIIANNFSGNGGIENNGSNNNLINNSILSGCTNAGIVLRNGGLHNIIDNSTSYGNQYGIKIEGPDDNLIKNLTAYNNNFGIHLINGSNNNSIENSNIYSNGSGGIYNYDSTNMSIKNSKIYLTTSGYGLEARWTSGLSIENSSFYNNPSGIYFYSMSYSKLKNSYIYNNSSKGIEIYSGTGNLIDGLVSYNNYYGVYPNTSNETTLNNVISFNNYYGINTSGVKTVINNSQFLNNSVGIYYSSNSGVLNNISSYNNGGNGIYFNSSSSKNKTNKINSYNNSNTLYSASSLNYYGLNNFFANTNNTLPSITYFSTGSYIPEINFDTGSILLSGAMSCDYSIKFDNYNNGINCSNTGNILYTGINPSFIFGTNIPKQIKPIFYSGGILQYSDIYFDTNKFIGQW